ncbi:MAG: type II toxin-antitoxin system Phd/YefM family antitoxin [Alkalibacterium sp.]|nr:type II toxin-antitoxin system Phd/YefM family antitoxin [Alkalibacterium sp.]
MAMKILDVPISSISEVKRSPMEIFKKADKEAAGVYVFNREKVAGVMLTQKQYETLNEEVDSLYDKIADLIAENRLQHEKVTTFSDSEVRGSIANEVPTIDEEDGWE